MKKGHSNFIVTNEVSDVFSLSRAFWIKNFGDKLNISDMSFYATGISEPASKACLVLADKSRQRDDSGGDRE